MVTQYTIDCKFSPLNIFRQRPFPMKIKHAKYVCRPIPILVAKVWRRNLDYVKNLQVKILPVKISRSTVVIKDTVMINFNRLS